MLNLFKFTQTKMQKFDYIVVGSGLAGLYAAYKASFKGNVAVITKSFVRESNSFNAQGGIAAVTSFEDDPQIHKSDTLIAGRGLCEDSSVDVLVNEGPHRIQEIIADGMKFDTENGALALGLEGGHHKRRILHAGGDSTGRWITEFVISKVEEKENITVYENTSLLDFLVAEGECYGVRCWSENPSLIGEEAGGNGKEVLLYANNVFLTSGGTSAIYARTTNPQTTIGDGLAVAYKNGCRIMDMEFIQFHPTALFHPGDRPSYLITEAMRGYGGVLRTKDGKEFMQKYDPRLSLAPRDIVARAIDNEMKTRGDEHVYLDATHKDPEETKEHFPNIYKKCLSIGIDITKDYIPVAPAAHYLCGGIKVDLDGQSSIRRLYAIGECSCTGLHGGNRLASNSLIEAIVYADAAAKHALSVLERYDYNEDIPEWNDEGTISTEERVLITQSMKEVNQIMEAYVGIVRSNTRLTRAWNRLDILYEETEALFKRSKATRELCELRNMINVGYLITRQAMERKESRGLHYTIDYPKS